jgi:hypothetical protein
MLTGVVSHRVWFRKKEIGRPLAQRMLDAAKVVSPFADLNGEIRQIQTAVETDEWIGIPRMLYVRSFRTVTTSLDVSRVGNGENLPELKPAYTLRPDDQAPDLNTFLRKLEEMRESFGFAGGIFRAFTGFGKSLWGMEMLRQLGGNSLIIVHQEALLTQWVSEIEKMIPGAVVGVVQGPRVDYKDCHFVVATIQSLWQDGKVPKEFWSHFRTILTDEIHRHGADKFAETLSKANPTYMIGMTGTVRRGDRMEAVFHHIVGDILHSAKDKNRIIPEVFLRETGFKTKSNLKRHLLVHKLKDSGTRTDFIAEDIMRCMRSQQGRNPIVMSQSLELLKDLSARIRRIQDREGIVFTHGFYVGGLKPQQREVAASAGLVFATIQLAKEGIDIPRLDTLFLVTPVSDPEQIVGRICRRRNENEAVVIDYVDSLVSELRRGYLSRLILYKQLGWRVHGKEKLAEPPNENEIARAMEYARPLQ